MCTCALCSQNRDMLKARAALEKAEQQNFAPSGSTFPIHRSSSVPEAPKLSVREKLERQRLNNLAQSEETYRQLEQRDAQFHLGWMQSTTTQSQHTLWSELFTPETPADSKSFIKRCNRHLNDPICQGEIIVLPTCEPSTSEERRRLEELMHQASIASKELSQLRDEEIATLHRYFELFSYQLDERIKHDGLPSDYYAMVSTGIGATAAVMEKHLNNINGILLEINDLYASHVAMASRAGGINYGEFTAERAALFKKLDGSFAMLSSRRVQLPIYTQVRRNLGLSTKSVIHNADEILKTGYVKDLGKRMANMAKGISAARGVGYVGLMIGTVSGVDNIYESCRVDGSGDCGRTVTREIGGFIGGWSGGSIAGSASATGIVLLLGVVGVTSAPVIAVASVGAFVVGGAAGGVAGATAGKWSADVIYEYIGDYLGDL